MSANKIIACLGIGLLVAIGLAVTDWWVRAEISHQAKVALYESEMKDRFAFDPDIQPQGECVQGDEFVGEWNVIKEYPGLLSGVPDGVGLYVHLTQDWVTWAYVGEWVGGKAHGRGKYTEYDKMNNKVLTKCDGMFEAGLPVETCNAYSRRFRIAPDMFSDSIAMDDLRIRLADLKQGCDHSMRVVWNYYEP
jgi:hypothetical protein